MKKTMAFLTALVLAAISVPFSVSAEGYAQGDVDMDGMITGHDAAIVSKYDDGELKMDITEEQLLLADMNGDGAVDVSDSAAIYEQQEYMLGDVDLNGTLYVEDVSYIVGMYRHSEEDYKELYGDISYILADVDCNGVINSDDANTVFINYAKLGASLPILEEGTYFYNFNFRERYDFNVDGEFTLDDVMLQIDCYAREAVGIGKARMVILSYGNDPDVDLDLKVKLDDVMITLTAYAESAAGLR